MLKGMRQISLKESPEPIRVSRRHDILGVNILKNNLAKGFGPERVVVWSVNE
jgi:hypothetical protein